MNAICVQLFLEAVRTGADISRRNAGGAHAVERTHAGLKFLHTHLRLPFDFAFSRPAGAVPATLPATAHTNPPLWPQDLALASTLACTASSQVLELCALLALALFSGGVRFAHAQRSRLKTVSPEGLVFSCRRGKGRRRGQAAPPFDWACPHSALFTHAQQARFVSLVRQVVPGAPNL